jgi:hypothetical protein
MKKERPIVFSAPMVRAILEGRKTQTRRIVKTGFILEHCLFNLDDGAIEVKAELCSGRVKCPYGKTGDRLWVRETWAGKAVLNWQMQGFDQETVEVFNPSCINYMASTPGVFVKKWRSPIHMPRWASRITLEVESVKVERLNDCSLDDALAEGVSDRDQDTGAWQNPKEQYADLWESINGPGSWDANPWVWVVSFKHIKP